MVISYAAKIILIRQSFYDAYCVVASKCLTVVHAKVFTLHTSQKKGHFSLCVKIRARTLPCI